MNAQREIKIVNLIKEIKILDSKLSVHLDSSDLSNDLVRASIRLETNKVSKLEQRLSTLTASL